MVVVAEVDGFLPPAKTAQRLVRVMSDLQLPLADTTDTLYKSDKKTDPTLSVILL